MSQYGIAIIGDDETVAGFGAAGIAAYPVSDSDSALGVLQNVRKMNYGIIFITEAYAKGLETLIINIGTEALPIIISIPGKEGSKGVGIKWLQKVAERAVGFDILSQNK
ncbi:MAG: V-type ATP synthase subunit F [Candidatus Thermoplasmatota archaeon]|nr:V-type ATP synthase subunit F [Candidatus Thermoplasmatota archaeon]